VKRGRQEIPPDGRTLTKKAEQAEATRAALLLAARALFTERGYAGTSAEDVAVAAGVTKGSVYYHFVDKAGIFRAVFVELERELNDHVTAVALAETGAWNVFLAGCRACLDFYVRPDYMRIALTDAPAVLGLRQWHDLDAALGLQTVEVGLQWLVDEGVLVDVAVQPLAILVFGALNQAGMTLAQAEDRELAKAELLTALEDLLTRLRPH
jgi:AcrR family transcriptional regulator